MNVLGAPLTVSAATKSRGGSAGDISEGSFATGGFGAVCAIFLTPKSWLAAGRSRWQDLSGFNSDIVVRDESGADKALCAERTGSLTTTKDLNNDDNHSSV